MYLPKKLGASLLALMMMVPNGAFRVLAEEAPADDPAPEVTEERDIEAEKEAFKAALEKDGYAEIGSYKVEKMRDGVYHMDEGTKAFPGGSTLDPYIDRVTGEEVSGVMNNPSSMYFVVTENEVVMIDGGDVLRSQEKYDSAKAILDVMTDGKPLTFIITHGHSDHVRMITTEGVLDDLDVKAIYVGEADYVDGQVVGSTTGTPLPVQGDLSKVKTVKEGDVITVDGLDYEIIDIPAHTPGSLGIVQKDKEVIFTGDSIGSGFVWAFWMYGDNPLGALQNGVQKLQGVIQGMNNGVILAGHRWQQFSDMFGEGKPNEMSIQYLNDLNAVINGLADGTTKKSPYTLRGNDKDIELSATGSKAKVDTQQEEIDAYLAALVKMDEAYIYSGSDKLSIESSNAVAAPTFVIYPDEILSDEDAKKLLVDSGIAEIVDRSASKAYVMRSYDVDDFKTVMQTKVAVTENFKLIGIGKGATFVNDNLSKYSNFISGLALIGGEGTPAPSASVPAYISGADASAYIAADKAEKTAEEGTFTTYVNPDSRFELVVTNSAEEDAVTGIKNAWDKVLNKFGRIGNWLDNSAGVGAVGTWYTRPLITGDDAVDTTRPYQYFDSIEAITDIRREVVTEDLDGDGQLNLWYEYIPAKAEDAEEGTVPVVLLMHGNTNDPRTQYDCSGWANIASREGIILVAPEWQGHTYQGYTYQPMVMTTEDVDSADFVKMIKMIEEKYPQIDASRIYIQGLSAGSRNTYMQGLANAKYLAAGAGQSGPFGVSGGANFEDVTRNKDKYDFPIIFFSGDADEYLMGTYDNTNVNAGSITTLNAFEALNDMAVTTADDLSMEYIADSGYPVKWDETYTIEQTPETVTYVKGGVKANDKNVEISFNRIYGWGHWNYMPDAEWQWDFMKKYARDLETGESIRLDLEPTERDIEAEKAAFKEDLEKEGYAELGSYKVEKMRDGVYHMDEETKACPGGATLAPYVDRVTGEKVTGVMNNPSSMYFVVTENEVVMIDGGDVLRSQEKYDSAKAILDVMTDGKPLTFIITHGHSDHVRMITTEGVLDDLDVKAIYVGEADYVDGQVVGSTTGTPLPVQGDLSKVKTVKEGDVITVDGLDYEIIDIPAHTPGSLGIVQKDKEVIFTGDSIGSGFVWAFWMYGDNPLGALQNGVQKLQGVIQGMNNGVILAGHRWQQFSDMFGEGKPNEMSIQYLNDLNAVINGLADGTTKKSPYTLRGNDKDIELSATGSKAKVDTQQEEIDAYLAALVKMDEAYIYSGSDKLSIESSNAVAAPTFVIYPDEILSDEDAKKLLVDSGIAEIVDRSASKAYVMRSYDVDDFKTVMQTKVAVTENFKLIGIGKGATFVNDNLSKYSNFISGLALIGGEGTPAPSASVPAYISGADASAYIAADKAEKTAEEGTFTTYVNPDSRFELVVTNSAEEDAVTGIKNAWDKVLNKFGRIGNWLDNSAGVGAVGTWYTRPLITGDDAVDTTRPYQYFDSIEAITDIRREVVTEDLDGDGQLNLWYEYIPAKAEDAEEGTVPVVLLMHGNTNDPRTQYDCSGWANIASREGIILVAPEWQGHTYQGYTYQPMVMTTEDVDSADFVKMIKMIEEKYPQIDASRIYIQGLSAGSRNTYMQGLANAKYLAAGAGQSGPFGVSGGANFEDVTRNKDKYDFPIIFFSGDADEYLMGTYDNTNVNAGSITTLNAFEALNDMAVTTADDLSMEYIADSGYPVKWDETYTIEQTPETVTYVKGGVKANDKNVEISFNRIYGWGHWNYMPDAEWQWDFMKKYARDLETGESIRLDLQPAAEPGVTIAENTDFPEVKVDNQVTFTYIAPEGTQDVALIGNFHFYYPEEVISYVAGHRFQTYTPYEYEPDMYNTGYDVAAYGYMEFAMDNVAGNVWQITMPLPGTQYFYDFVVTDKDGKKTTIKDPTNLPFANNGADSGHSLIYVGDKDHCIEGQEYIYPREDEKVGTVEYVDYTDINGDKRTIGVYLPYGYDVNGSYKTLYLCHGGGGNEVEWFNIGSAKNIYDNLIAEGEVEPTVVITMNNTVYNFERGPSVDNILKVIKPLVEAKYAVSKEADDRAIAGLSSGASVTDQAALENNDEFAYYGIFSPSRTLNFIKTNGVNTVTPEQKKAFGEHGFYYVSVGEFDSFVRRNVNVDTYDELKEDGAKTVFFWKPGAHDWAVWRNQLTEFTKDYLWDALDDRFVDVRDESKYYYNAVYWARDLGITKGYAEDNTFRPEEGCTRAQMVTFLWRMAGKPEPSAGAKKFPDVASNQYYYKAVLWAAEKGITKGYADGTFKPDDVCLREHAVTFLYRYAGQPSVKATVNPFNDVKASDYYYRATLWANENGIANGYSTGEHAGGFGPKLECLREHIVTFLYRYAK